jgi:hypothetical protein
VFTHALQVTAQEAEYSLLKVGECCEAIAVALGSPIHCMPTPWPTQGVAGESLPLEVKAEDSTWSYSMFGEPLAPVDEEPSSAADQEVAQRTPGLAGATSMEAAPEGLGFRTCPQAPGACGHGPLHGGAAPEEREPCEPSGGSVMGPSPDRALQGEGSLVVYGDHPEESFLGWLAEGFPAPSEVIPYPSGFNRGEDGDEDATLVVLLTGGHVWINDCTVDEGKHLPENG